MIPIEVSGERTAAAARSRAGSRVPAMAFGSFGRPFQKSFQKSIARRTSGVATTPQVGKGAASDSASGGEESEEEEAEEEFNWCVC